MYVIIIDRNVNIVFLYHQLQHLQKGKLVKMLQLVKQTYDDSIKFFGEFCWMILSQFHPLIFHLHAYKAIHINFVLHCIIVINLRFLTAL